MKRPFALLLPVCLLFFAVGPHISLAGRNVWTSNGPGGGLIYALAIDPETPSTVYAGGVAGMFKTINGGASWTAINNGISGFLNTHIDCIARILTPSTLYVGTNQGVYKSIDAGLSWFAINTGLPPPDPSFGLIVDALAIDHSDVSVVYAGACGGRRFSCAVFKTTDAGGSWAAVGLEVPYQSVTALTIDPAHPSTVYVAFAGGPSNVRGVFMYKSTDAGQNWVAFGPSAYGGYSALAIDPLAPSTFYAAAFPANIWKSVDAGANWIPLWDSTGLNPSGVQSLVLDASTMQSTLYSAGGILNPSSGLQYYGVLRSTDGGETWTDFSTGLPVGSSFPALRIDDTGTFFHVGTATGVFDYLRTDREEIVPVARRRHVITVRPRH